MGIALEPDFILELPDIPKEPEPHTTKRKLIEPVTAASEAVKRRRDKDTKALHKINYRDNTPVTSQSLTYEQLICKVLADLQRPPPNASPIWQWLSTVDKKFVQSVTKLLDTLCPF